RPCQYNECFRTVLCTPMHPSYPSGHSASAGCMAEILSFFFPGEREKLFMLARQCSYSRLYAGVHFKADCDEGINLGVSIAKAIIEYTSKQTDCYDNLIDKQYTNYKDANIIPINLTQYIPFNRLVACPSLLLDTSCCT
ncbi:MAG: phosphatase PAP2 family protein, partial [Romboutsia sp.]|uniref:phosphatase PAP2 family protein n=1 Tax=Romboutsia sp. TaxID=1965302 RepID=UPI003F3C7F52